jgi:hypothetical protein
MTTITRKQLISAVEAGIERAQADGRGFTQDEAVRLRDVAATTRIVARGTYGTYDATTADGPCVVGCPVAQAFPGTWPDLGWEDAFTSAYDLATGAFLPPLDGDEILEITDEPLSD